jgi:hypothetical protein
LNFKALTKQSSTINLGGLRIGGLLNTADGVSIRTVPADFGALLGGVAGATINLGGVRIGTLLNAGEDGPARPLPRDALLHRPPHHPLQLRRHRPAVLRVRGPFPADRGARP